MIGKELTWDTHVPPPNMEFALLGNKTQVCGAQISFRSGFLTMAYQSFVFGVAHVHRCHPSIVIFDLHLECLATKNTRRKAIS